MVIRGEAAAGVHPESYAFRTFFDIYVGRKSGFLAAAPPVVDYFSEDGYMEECFAGGEVMACVA